mgnify:CR=1 FL=1
MRSEDSKIRCTRQALRRGIKKKQDNQMMFNNDSINAERLTDQGKQEK